MPKLIYLDILQMVTHGGDGLNPELFDFYVFGSFDALKYIACSPNYKMIFDDILKRNMCTAKNCIRYWEDK